MSLLLRSSIPLYGNEVLMDQYQASPFEKDLGQLFSEAGEG
jgi:hypothetical protein